MTLFQQVCGVVATLVRRRRAPRTLGEIEELVSAAFPAVATVSAVALAAGPRRRILDVRTLGEFSVSHLEGAEHVSPATPTAQIARGLGLAHPDPIVTVCAVGWRSARLAEGLQALGYCDVVNLEGGIFRWATEGRPLVDGQGRPTQLVHAYSRQWQHLVPAGRRTL